MSAERRLRISDHALVRFIARTSNGEIEAVRGAIAGALDRAAESAAAIGATDYTIVADGLRYQVRGGVVVTVMPERQPAAARRAPRRGE